nr:uncharacterized protein LOC129282865 [Lytechinus pictus]
MKKARNVLKNEKFFIIDDLTNADLQEKRKWAKQVQALYAQGTRMRFYAGKWRVRGGDAYNFETPSHDVLRNSASVQKEFQFSIQPMSKHLKIILQDGGKVQKRMMPIKGILSGECDPLIFKLQFSAEEKGNKDLNITIQEDLKRTAEKQISISIEDEPDYAVDNITDT